MVEKIQTLLVLLGIIGVLAVVAERVKFPFPILLVIAGLLIALFPGLPEARLDPELVFLIFLPPLLFSAAWNFPWEDFRSNFLPIFALAVGLVFVTLICVAYAASWLIPGMTLATGFVLGAIASPPDAVAATAVLKNLRIPKRLSSVLEGESLVNDASGLVAYQFAVTAVVTGSFSLLDATGDFMWMSAGGVAFGLLIGMGAAHLHRHLKDPAVAVSLHRARDENSGGANDLYRRRDFLRGHRRAVSLGPAGGFPRTLPFSKRRQGLPVAQPPRCRLVGGDARRSLAGRRVGAAPRDINR
jgi:monovalent cation/hydrogen antiporter